MKLILSSPRGFCAGVDRAITIVDQALELLPHPIYVNHEIVHNSHVVDDFRQRGVIFVEGIDSVPSGATLIFNAHGVPPALIQKAQTKKLKIIDATCPLVSKVHFEAIRYAKKGYNILLIGHRGHAEVIGVTGEAESQITVVESPEEVNKLPFTSNDKLAYITQTTLSIDDCQGVIDALLAKYPQIEAPKKSDICYATTNRQTAVKEISKIVDVIIVVGSSNSSNSNRLREVAEKNGARAFMVNESDELKREWFNESDTVGITAGASTPESVVQNVVLWMRNEFSVTAVTNSVSVEENEIFSLPKIN